MAPAFGVGCRVWHTGVRVVRNLRPPTSWSTGGHRPRSPPRAPTFYPPLGNQPVPSFTSLGVPEVLVRALTKSGITEPFPIQTATLPATMTGSDVLGRGRTGSGKTLAFALPMVARLSGRRSAVRRPRPRTSLPVMVAGRVA